MAFGLGRREGEPPRAAVLAHCTEIVAATPEAHRAAQRAHMTQPGMSRLIRDLEQDVGVPLFARTTRTVVLTEAGKAFLAESREALARLERAVSRARRTAGGEVGVIRQWADVDSPLPVFFPVLGPEGWLRG